MSPVTHFLTGWVVANCSRLNRRERAIVALAFVAPDIDGLGIIPELLTRNSSHPSVVVHAVHSLHILTFAPMIATVAWVLATERWKVAGLAVLNFHIHLVKDILGSQGPDGYQGADWHLSPRACSLHGVVRGA